ncbi:MAG TPA: deoxyguanosinetriphosphate triphosphohydrolase [Bacteroidales bacterium]|nr:deoxyguanosinetriphosphate triphosphohydrolase [Bacteroidales bacterium]
MQWEQLLSSKRFGNESFKDDRAHDRSEFQRDYDRLIFSSPFRRLQNKTQVFPLPGSVFVHNRLTHSLEVSSVGRSLGSAVSKVLRKKYGLEHQEALTEMGDIVSAACLAHDLGNPPFGHSGEKAIASYFTEGEGLKFKDLLSPSEYTDFTCFEGNANAFRLLTHTFNGRRSGGFALTYSTLASIVKYPYASTLADPKKAKFGFFNSEAAGFEQIATELGLIRVPDKDLRFRRHPLVFLVEAADDICYQIMDLEDAHKLKLISTEETKSLMMNYFSGERLTHIKETLHFVDDVNEQIAYLRSCVIGRLIKACTKVFTDNEESIMDGSFIMPLIKLVDEESKIAFERIAKISLDRIYRSSDVLDIELAGYKIITTLLHEVTQAVNNPDRAYSKVLLARIPQQYEVCSTTVYGRIQAALDYISGMTDVYALDLYQKMNGTSLPAL